MAKVILLTFADDIISAAQQAQIRALAPGYELLYTGDRAVYEPRLAEIEIVAGSFPHELIARAPALRWFQQWGAGADWLLRMPAVQEQEFVLTNASGIHAIQIAEHIFAFLLAFARNLPQALRAQSDHVWVSNRWQVAHSSTIKPGQTFHYFINNDAVFELAGKQMLIAGVGEIGARTAKLAKAFDMEVVGVRRNPDQTVADVDKMVGFDSLMVALPQADFVVNALPYTGETQHLFDAAAFAAMRQSAYFVNIGRGGTHHEADLIAALQSGAIAGAGLDVFAQEPLPADSPLWDLPNVIITSHYAGLTPVYDARAFAIFIDNLARYMRQAPLRNVVDKTLGY